MFYVYKDGKDHTANAFKAFTLAKKEAVSLLRRHKRSLSEECREGCYSEETRESCGNRERGVSFKYFIQIYRYIHPYPFCYDITVTNNDLTLVSC